MGSMKKYTLGLDPGAKGAAVLFEDTKIKHVYQFKMIGGRLDDVDLGKFFRRIRKLNDLVAYLENVHAIFGSSAKSTFNFGESKGILRGMLAGLNIRYIEVEPKTWQAYSWSGINKIVRKKKGNKRKSTDTKATSLLAAKRLFPNEPFKEGKQKVPQEGLIDAALIGWYGVKHRP